MPSTPAKAGGQRWPRIWGPRFIKLLAFAAALTLYRLLTEDAQDVLWRTDARLIVTYISPADERLRGFRADEVVGRHVFEMFTEEGVAVVKAMIWLRERADFPGFNAVYGEYFPVDPPARSAVVSELLVDVRVEVEVVAWRPLEQS